MREQGQIDFERTCLSQAVLRGEQAPLGADPLSEMVSESSLKMREYKIQDRDITRYWQTIFFQRELKANPYKLYDAMLAVCIKQASHVFLTCHEQAMSLGHSLLECHLLLFNLRTTDAE